MNRVISILAVFALLCARSHAQTVALSPNMLPVCSEPCSIDSISNPAAVLQFGIGSAWAPAVAASSLTFPLIVDDGQFPNTILAPSDPDQGVVKTLDAQQSTAPYSITWNAGDTPGTVPETTITIPALTSLACAAPTTVNANPVIPPTPPNCVQLPNAYTSGIPDGASLVNFAMGAPVILQRCVGTVCAAPFMFAHVPMTVGPNPACGGPVSATDTGGTGTLYVIESAMPAIAYYIPASGGTTQSSLVIPGLPARTPPPPPVQPTPAALNIPAAS